jgi:hypothetical protein
MVKVDISLCNVHMREKLKIMTRTRKKIRDTRKTRNSQRSPMGKLMSVKSGTQVMRVSSWRVMT